MKPETLYAIAEITRSSTPYVFGLIGLTIILCGIFNSDRLSGDRFAYVMGAGGAFGGYAAGGFSPQNRSPQNRINADQVDIDQSK